MPCELQDVTNKQRLIEILKKMLINKLIRPNEKKNILISQIQTTTEPIKSGYKLNS